MIRKILFIFLLAVYALLLLFYLGLVVPEYLACADCMYEGEKGIDLWGSEIDCSGENRSVGEAFFQLLSVVLTVYSILIIFIIYLIRRSKFNTQRY
ncbi:hypothetical protein ACR78F_20380 [Sphingobacterium spiritivorum]|uniref:hypothetical protein n=1 Tax=Sphingobacterium spiritivorum TaxID=258 RepID=UPI003DA36F23